MEDLEILTPVENALWSVLHTRSRQEKKLGRILEASNIPHYVPTIRIKTRHRGVKKFTDKLVFPGYIFAAIHQEAIEDKEVIYGSKCVVNVINEPNDTDLLNDLNQLRALLHAKGDRMIQEITRIKPGAKIIVKHGPFKGIEGVVMEHRGKEMLIISVNMLGRSVAVELDETSVAPEL